MGRSKLGYEIVARTWKFFRWIDKVPVIGNTASGEKATGHIVPIEQTVRAGENTVLPLQVLRPMIERADGVAIMKECICRRGEKCRRFPWDLGCLTLGSAVKELNPAYSRIVTPDEAIAHAERAIRMGLVPLIIHDPVDAWYWKIDFDRMMNVCFCCDCCCDVRLAIRNKKLRGLYQNMHRLPGLTVSVGEGCVSCGTCRDLCLAGAIELREDGAHIGENCKGCGRCVPACPQHAITMAIDPEVDTIGLTLETYERHTNVGPLTGTRDAEQ